LVNIVKNIGIQEYDYPLPEERIAQFPMQERDQSRLLLYRDGQIAQDVFSNLSDHIPAKSLMVFNETRVIHARLRFQKLSGSAVEVFCLEPVAPVNDIQLAFQQTAQCTWKCLVGNARRWKGEQLSLTVRIDETEITLKAEKGDHVEDAFYIRFSWFPENIAFAQVLETFGKIPLPPYIGREAAENDSTAYQTMFARYDGSVAAPTAGLHFTPGVMESLTNKSIGIEKVTLHVGAGTFKPVTSETLENHHMHSEQVIIPAEVVESLLANLSGHITLVGTTTVRTIESLYWQGVKWLLRTPLNPFMHIGQWDPYQTGYNCGISVERSLNCVIETLHCFGLQALQGSTSLLIAPGYTYRIPDAIITNFHQPRSTLLLLVAAFIGPDWKKAYDYAILNDFRFLSYGDSCLFFKNTSL
jgi:S-adenosylmethionine:tRNA ribosyltransferase-isomerase